MKWWFKLRRCRRCGEEFAPKRQAQIYCSKDCRVYDAVDRFRGKEAITNPPPLPTYLRSDNKACQRAASAPPPHPGAAARLRNSLINGIFADEAELETYQRELAEIRGCI